MNRNLSAALCFVSVALFFGMYARQAVFAADPKDRFLEFHGKHDTSTYDLTSVEVIQPDKFTIRHTLIDDAEIITLKMKALDTLRSYCSRPDGEYEAPEDMLTLGSPDMPVAKIELQSRKVKIANKEYPSKIAIWTFPYDGLAVHHEDGRVEQYPAWFDCQSPLETQEEAYAEARSSIMNGNQEKEMYDCRRFVMGVFSRLDEDASKAFTFAPRGGYLDRYMSVCYAVTGKVPYTPHAK